MKRILIFTALFLTLIAATSMLAAAQVTVRINPATTTVAAGSADNTVELQVTGANTIQQFDFEVSFDPATCAAVWTNQDGSDFTLVTGAGDITPDGKTMRVAGFNFNPATPVGDPATLAVLHFNALNAGDTPCQIKFASTLTDGAGNPIAFNTQFGTLNITGLAAPEVTVRINPATTNVAAGSADNTVELQVTGANTIQQFDFEVSFDPATCAAVWTNQGGSDFTLVTGAADITPDGKTIRVAGFNINPANPVGDPTTLAVLHFDALNAGDTPCQIRFASTLTDGTGAPIAFGSQFGTLNVTGLPGMGNVTGERIIRPGEAPPDQVAANGLFEIEYDIAINQDNVTGLALKDKFPDGFAFQAQLAAAPGCTRVTNPATLAAEDADVMFFCGTKVWNDGDTAVFRIRVQAPNTVGVFNFPDGAVSGVASPRFENALTGEDQIEVTRANFCQAYDRSPADNDMQVTEVNQAISNWRFNTPAPNGLVPQLGHVQNLLEILAYNAIFTGEDNKTCDDYAPETFNGVGPAAVTIAPQAKSGGLLAALWSFLFHQAPTTMVQVERSLSAAAVEPGGSFEVSVRLIPQETVVGLALEEALPAGWTAELVAIDGGYFKADEAAALWVSSEAGETHTLTYRVTVPADAAAGSYTLGGRVSAGAPRFTSDTGTVTVKVAAAQPLSLETVKFTGSRFVAQGSGIAQIAVQVYNLAGGLVFDGAASGNSLEFSRDVTLANGVYLYVVTVAGADGRTLQSEVRKLVILR